MQIRYTRRAERCIERIDDWWQAHRPAAPDLFLRELDEAAGLLVVTPEAGVPYKTRKGSLVRYVLLPRTKYHVYYEVERAAGVVMILSVWSAVRGRRPVL